MYVYTELKSDIATMVSDNIIVTGFGPFGGEEINASWECVKLLPLKFNDVNVIVKEIPVVYEYIDEEVPILWETYKPKLVVHVGVSPYKELTIETQAFRTGYIMADCKFNEHPTGCCAKEGPDCIEGTIDVEQVCEIVNNNNKIRARSSKDAGRYLCEYIFYKSLNIDKNRTMFIHVPQLNKPYCADELADGISHVINCVLKQLDKISCKYEGS